MSREGLLSRQGNLRSSPEKLWCSPGQGTQGGHLGEVVRGHELGQADVGNLGCHVPRTQYIG